MWRIGKFIKSSRQKLQAMIDRVPRKLQVVINLLLILAFALIVYITAKSPAFSVEQAFRRAEKANLVGPSRILGIEYLGEDFGSKAVVVAQTERSAIAHFDPVNTWDDGAGSFICREKMGDISVYGVPCATYGSAGDYIMFIVMDDYPAAVRSELDLELFAENSETGNVFRKLYTLEATRQNQGYFRMDLYRAFHYAGGRGPASEEGAIDQFANWSLLPPTYLGGYSYPATVRLYNEADELICERSLDLFPEAD